MGLEKVFEVEIDGKDYKIEMDNLAYLNFERLVGASPVTWSLGAQTTTGQPKYDHMLKLLICALKKHHPKLRLTVDMLQAKVKPRELFINLNKDSLGDKLIEALTATLAEDDDISLTDSDPMEEVDKDPLDESEKTGQTSDG